MATAYEIVMTADAREDLTVLRAYDLRIIIQIIEEHLTYQPHRVSRSRIKKLTQPAISQYRLRAGDFRIYYDVDDDDERVVILQVHEKGRGTTRDGDTT